MNKRAIFALSLVLSAALGSTRAALIPSSGIFGTAGSDAIPKSTVFNSDNPVISGFTLRIKPADVGKVAPIYLVARAFGRWFMRNESGVWVEWDQNIDHLVPVAVKTLDAQETIDVVKGESLRAGEYTLLAGYNSEAGDLYFNSIPLTFAVFDINASGLHPLESDWMLEAYLKDGLQHDLNDHSYYYNLTGAEVGFSPVADNTAESRGPVSTTTLQESGVDEADRIKSAGQNLYVVGSAAQGQANSMGANGESMAIWPGDLSTTTVLRSYRVSESPAGATLLDTLNLDANGGDYGLYLVTDRAEPLPDMIVAIGSNGFDYSYWVDAWYWRDQKTRLQFIDADTPANLRLIETLEFDGNLIASRRVGETLYLVTRYTSSIPGILSYPALPEDMVRNESVLNAAALDDLLPNVVDGSGGKRTVVAATDCYLAPVAENQSADPSLVTLTAIPLASPLQFHSTCIVGASEALYVSPNNLYLASTRYGYHGGEGIAVDGMVYPEDHRTLIHKFTLKDTEFGYSGSGEVRGHLGWEKNKKSFRMGENGDVLNVVTSIGATWAGNSTTRLAVLREAESADRLEEVGHIDGLGEPGERLYASRFFGDRGYLVTFRVTDPLYVLDLSDPTRPAVSGELHLDGYSDYLFPVGDGFLLGIGKDAVPDTTATDFEGRGAWYQGVKLSLFDVTDSTNPLEVDSMVLGKRGTSSEALYDHHAYTFLPAAESRAARVTIPVELHATEPNHVGFDASIPSAWYDWTHTGLYEFEIDLEDDPDIRETGRLVIEDSGTGPSYTPLPDRSLLFEDSVHYIHGNSIYSASWGDMAR